MASPALPRKASAGGLATRIVQSLRWRFFFGYCRQLEKWKKKKILVRTWECTASSSAPLVSIVYLQDIWLLDRCLNSLAVTQKLRPPLILIGDSDQAHAELLRRFSCEGITIHHWEKLLGTLAQKEREFVRTWLNSGRWGGYAKKFAITLALQRTGPLLLSDADVLWFTDILESRFREWMALNQIIIGADYNRAYDLQVADQLQEPRLRTDVPVNCGFVYYPQGILDRALTAEVFEMLLPFAAKATNHLEQTIIGYAFWRTAGAWFSPTQLATTLKDDFAFRRSVDSAIRHYAGAKHLFWRDA
jgi:hypothetical protein